MKTPEFEKTMLANCVRLVAYAQDCYPDGWMARCVDFPDGIDSDYTLVHSNPANIANHHAVKIIVTRKLDKEDRASIGKIKRACETANGYAPHIHHATATELQRAREGVMESFEDSKCPDLACWLATVLDDVCDETAPDFDKLADFLRQAKP